MMSKIKFGYTAAHELRSPNDLLSHGVLAEENGFDYIMASDHFHPWSHTRAHGGFAWVWIASAAERTQKIMIGTGVTPPILRYHPALVAQAFATLQHMYPGRIFLGLGTGEAMNEVPLGFDWPPFKERIKRLEEAIQIIKALWQSSFVDFDGTYFKIRRANLYTKPPQPIPVYIAAKGENAARLAGMYGDGLLASAVNIEKCRDLLFPAFHEGVRLSGRNPDSLEKLSTIHLAFDDDYEKASKALRFWAALKSKHVFDSCTYDPRELEEAGKIVSDQELAKFALITSNPEDCIKALESHIRIGFTMIRIVSSSPDEEKCLYMFGKDVLPYLRERYANP